MKLRGLHREDSFNIMRKALIFGISGQDGAYLAQFLLYKGYKVYGTSRDVQMSSFRNLSFLKIRSQIGLFSVAVNDFRSILQVITKVEPDEIYNLAGQSSVGLSFEQPVETLESIATGTLNILEAIRFTGLPIKFYNAGSSECFGDTDNHPANEETPFSPRSPYAVAKSTAFWEVANYREAYQLFACTGILFNHESPLRPKRFVTRKIIAAAVRIASGSQEKLFLGNLNIKRDWGWAPEYVEAMWRMLQLSTPSDFVIATGETRKLSDFVQESFAKVGLNWKDHVEIDNDLLRPTDLKVGRADPSRAMKLLGWKAKNTMPDVVRLMIDVEKNRISLKNI